MTIRELIEELELLILEYGDLEVYSSTSTVDGSLAEITPSVEKSYTRPTILVL